MLPSATILHTLQDRTRFHIPSRKGDAVFFAAVEKNLASHPQVHQVIANPLTGSVLVRHNMVLADLTRYAQDQQLFTLQAEEPAASRVLNLASDSIDQVDHLVRRTTQGAFDLTELLFVGLIAAAIIQFLRGRVLGSATTLLSYAATLLVSHRTRGADQEEMIRRWPH
jgi:hypothetical protein